MARRRPRAEAELPPSLASQADIAAHLQRLTSLEPRFRPVLERVGEVPPRKIEPGFVGLFQVVTSQQISAAAGRAIFARCVTALGAISAETVAAVDDATLKSAGLSAPKIRTLRAAAHAVLSGHVVLERLIDMEADQAVAHLVTVKGIGPWTAQSYLLFALAHPDVFPAGDLALSEGARVTFGLPQRPTEKALAALAEAWRPHRSAAARLLWAYYAVLKRADATPTARA